MAIFTNPQVGMQLVFSWEVQALHGPYLLTLSSSRVSRHIGQQLDAREDDPSQCVQPLSMRCCLSSCLPGMFCTTSSYSACAECCCTSYHWNEEVRPWSVTVAPLRSALAQRSAASAVQTRSDNVPLSATQGTSVPS